MFFPGDLVSLRQDLPNKPVMIVVRKESTIFRDDIKNNMSIVSIEGDRNGYRMPSSHTLSLEFNIRKQRERTSSILSFGVYNVYSQKNPMFVYWKQNTDNVEPQNAQFELKQFSLIAWPWPYLRYSIKF